ncbi:16931_t:CDS:2, partial [Dentiscutata heterogama]
SLVRNPLISPSLSVIDFKLVTSGLKSIADFNIVFMAKSELDSTLGIASDSDWDSSSDDLA